MTWRFRRIIQKICKRDPFTGHVVTGGIVTVEDSNWLMSWTLNRQQQFRDQPKGQLCVWVYGLFPDKPGNYVKKPMQECTGEEICEEWLYHMGVPVEKIEDLAKNHANTVPVMMPYIDAFFMPRSAGDRPDVVPDGAVNFAFLGQFAETPARHDLHHRVFDAHRHGSGVHAVRCGPWRAGSVGFGLRRTQPAQRHGNAA